MGRYPMQAPSLCQLPHGRHLAGSGLTWAMVKTPYMKPSGPFTRTHTILFQGVLNMAQMGSGQAPPCVCVYNRWPKEKLTRVRGTSSHQTFWNSWRPLASHARRRWGEELPLPCCFEMSLIICYVGNMGPHYRSLLRGPTVNLSRLQSRLRCIGGLPWATCMVALGKLL